MNRVDEAYKDNSDYIYLIVAERVVQVIYFVFRKS